MPIDEDFQPSFKNLGVYLGFPVSTMAIFTRAVRNGARYKRGRYECREVIRFSRSGTRQEFRFSRGSYSFEILRKFRYALLVGVRAFKDMAMLAAT